MTWTRLLRAELRKLTTTRMPWGFVAALVVIAAINGIAIVFGTDMDGSKSFIATLSDQRELLAFGTNALLGAGLFGAIAVAREYGHNTVVPTFLAAPRRQVTMLAQFTAVVIAGAALSMIGQLLVFGAAAASLPFTDYGFLLPAGTVVRLLATTALAGGVGAMLGAGVGAVVRNAGGAVAASGLLLFILPPLIPQLASGTADWMPASLLATVAGIADGPALAAAFAALLAWAAVPLAAGLTAVQRRDVI
jgi:hypothetical protein